MASLKGQINLKACLISYGVRGLAVADLVRRKGQIIMPEKIYKVTGNVARRFVTYINAKSSEEALERIEKKVKEGRLGMSAPIVQVDLLRQLEGQELTERLRKRRECDIHGYLMPDGRCTCNQ